VVDKQEKSHPATIRQQAVPTQHDKTAQMREVPICLFAAPNTALYPSNCGLCHPHIARHLFLGEPEPEPDLFDFRSIKTHFLSPRQICPSWYFLLFFTFLLDIMKS